MIYREKTMNILNQLGACKTYKGYHYILSSIEFIHEHETNFLPITKILYVDIAKQYNTSDKCIEKNIRKVIELIWKQDKNPELIIEIFGENNTNKRLSNASFLILLYDYILSNINRQSVTLSYEKEYVFTCPISGTICKFCNNVMCDTSDTLELSR